MQAHKFIAVASDRRFNAYESRDIALLSDGLEPCRGRMQQGDRPRTTAFGILRMDMPTDHNPGYIELLVALQVALIVILAVHSLLRLRTKAEARRDFTNMTRVARLSLVAEITSSVAHNITQPLTSILTNVEAAELLLNRSDPDLGAVREILADIRRDDLRANRIVDGLRTPLRKRELQVEPVDINALTANVLSLILPDAIRRKVVIRSELAHGLPKVQGDALQLQQVLLSLVSNAMDAMSETPAEARCLDIHTARADDEHVRVAVLDSGCGIDPGQTDRLFDSFFTTKRDGLGLGLSFARSIIRMHGGSIWAENRASGGAAFVFTVPLSHRIADSG